MRSWSPKNVQHYWLMAVWFAREIINAVVPSCGWKMRMHN